MDYRTLVNKLEAIQRGELSEDVAAVWTPTPEQAKWLGGADQQDPYILNRMPGAKPPISWFKDPADQAKAKQMGFPEAPAVAPQQVNANATSDAFIKQKLTILKDLTAKLEAGAGGQGAKPATMPAQATSVDQAKALGAANPQVKESSIAKELVESFGYETTDEGIASALMKGAGKALPGVGLALGAKDAYDRVKAGDYTGAAIAGAGGVANLIPGLGTAAQLGLMGVQAGRDKARTGSWLPDDAEIAAASAAPGAAQAAKPAAGVDPKVQALQQKLIAAGAKIQADGIMGPQTQAAMKQFPQVKESVAESMASLRDRLSVLETEQVADEGIASSLAKFGSQAVKGAKFGFANPTAAKNLTNASMSLATKGGRLAGRGAQAVAKVPGAKALGATAAGAAAGYALTPGAAGAAGQAAKPTKPQGSKPTAPAAPAATTADPALIQQIQATMAELADIESPEVMAELDRARAALTKAGVAE